MLFWCCDKYGFRVFTGKYMAIEFSEIVYCFFCVLKIINIVPYIVFYFVIFPFD